ncbi:hypothetical protein PYCCODRAFT_837609 [Trametes coccinea BRFM310]|uniref:Secreted protein n=1 Tax=Trametes coccinea (strain BRFM310) TaxID=1353009 RepID=A0A1Y2IFQ9_TRAC3|nr:hypothetical protein PYCCODRAFT_837609 [Trametes coccinea BRFM310]
MDFALLSGLLSMLYLRSHTHCISTCSLTSPSQFRLDFAAVNDRLWCDSHFLEIYPSLLILSCRGACIRSLPLLRTHICHMSRTSLFLEAYLSHRLDCSPTPFAR